MTKLKCFLFIVITMSTILGCEKETMYQYEVTGTAGSFFVTCEGSPNGTIQYSNVGSGWTYSWSQTGTRWLYLSAQNNTSSGTVTVKIVRNGKVIAQQTSDGGYVISTVDGDY